MTNERLRMLALGLALAAAGCGEPIVPRGPGQLYRLAQEQVRNRNYPRAADTLARIAREAPDTPLAAKAELTRLALLAGLARAGLRQGQLYREAARVAPAEARGGLRTAAQNSFGLAQSWALALVEGLEPWAARVGQEVRLDPVLPLVPPVEPAAAARLRAGEVPGETEREAMERAGVERALAEVMAALVGTRGDYARAQAAVAGPDSRLEAAWALVAFGEELLELRDLYAREALDNPRYARLLAERALSLAERAFALGVAGQPVGVAADGLKTASRRALGGR